MLWESLITPGHVRGARVRRLQPWIVAAGLVLIWLGIWVVSRAPLVRNDTSVLSILQQRVSKLQARAEAAIAGLPRLALSPAEIDALPPLSQVAEVIDAALKSLDHSGALPSDTFKFAESDGNALWKGSWSSERLHYVKAGDFYLVAANVNGATDARPQPVRWIGVFRQVGDKWQYCSLAGPGLYVPRQFPTSRPGEIALSLAPALPDER